MTNDKIIVQHIDHVTIVISDLEATRDFYVDVLGMEEVPRPAFSFPGIWFQAGTTLIHATLESDEAGQAGWGGRGVRVTSRGHHFAFCVADADASAEVLRKRGIPIASGPQTRPDGAVQVYLNDPDGHLIELFSMPETLPEI